MHRIVISTKKAPIPLGPYVQAVGVGNIIFVSGQIGICPDTNIMPHNVYDQTHQALQNIRNIIEIADLMIENITKTTLFIVDINDIHIINTSYKKFFELYFLYEDTNLPARSCVEVSKLPKNAKIIIEAIAIRSE